MPTRPVYDEDRTDNTEILFNALFYMQLLDEYKAPIAALKAALVAEFDPYPVEFDKEKQAFRQNEPYRYYESGVVTLTGNRNSEHEAAQVILDAWSPEKRPKPRAKANRKPPAPNYLEILKVNPIWYLQLMFHEGRKTKKHIQYASNTKTDYPSSYKQLAIYKSLPESEQGEFITPDFEQQIEHQLRRATFNFNFKSHDITHYGQLSNSYDNRRPDTTFFFLNEQEIEKLAEALAHDQLESKNNMIGYKTHTHAIAAVKFIRENAPAERVTIDTQEIQRYRKINFHTFDHTIIDHEYMWEQLHEQYTVLNDNQLAALREFNLLDDELLTQIKNNAQQAIAD